MLINIPFFLQVSASAVVFAKLGSVYNPLIYYFTSKRFQNYTLKLIGRVRHNTVIPTHFIIQVSHSHEARQRNIAHNIFHITSSVSITVKQRKERPHCTEGNEQEDMDKKINNHENIMELESLLEEHISENQVQKFSLSVEMDTDLSAANHNGHTADCDIKPESMATSAKSDKKLGSMNLKEYNKKTKKRPIKSKSESNLSHKPRLSLKMEPNPAASATVYEKEQIRDCDDSSETTAIWAEPDDKIVSKNTKECDKKSDRHNGTIVHSIFKSSPELRSPHTRDNELLPRPATSSD